MTNIGEAFTAVSFGERAPGNEVEADLIRLQRRSDAIGKEAWQSIVTGGQVPPDMAASLEDLRREAGVIMGEVVEYNKPASFVARYFYDENENHAVGKELQYPLDYMFFAARISGNLTEVRSLPAEHPSPDRDGKIGLRLCAQIQATRVMGWDGSLGDNRNVYVPIGELYLTGDSTDRQKSEVLIPN